MTTLHVNCEALNEKLQLLGYDFSVRPVHDGRKYFWLHHNRDIYVLKVSYGFIAKLSEILKLEEEDSLDFIFEIFTEFSVHVKSSFVVYDKLGFIAKDYAEFYLDYSIADEALMNYSGSRLMNPSNFRIDALLIEIGCATSLITLLNQQYQDDSLEDIQDYPTIRIKGTSKESLEDDLFTALYYLRLVAPSVYGDAPKLRKLINEEDIFINDVEEHDGSEIQMRRPKYPIPLRFYYHAELLTGDEAILYYYKVIEYFFEIAWRVRVRQLVSEHQHDTDVLVNLLNNEQPRSEEMYLRSVIKVIESDELWENLQNEGFTVNDVNSLAQDIYKIRNRVAHGKGSFHLDIIIPSLIPSQEMILQRILVKIVAYEVLRLLAEVVSFG